MSDDYSKKWFEESGKGAMVNTTLLVQFNKQIEQFNTQAKTSWDQFLKLIQTSYVDSTQKTIGTNAQGGPIYKTTIKLEGD